MFCPNCGFSVGRAEIDGKKFSCPVCAATIRFSYKNCFVAEARVSVGLAAAVAMIVLMVLDHFWLGLFVIACSESLFDLVARYCEAEFSGEVVSLPPGYVSPEYLRAPPLSEGEYGRLSTSLHPLGIA